MNRKLVRWIALITVIAFFATTLGMIGYSAFAGR